jgi:hypothetical protein
MSLVCGGSTSMGKRGWPYELEGATHPPTHPSIHPPTLLAFQSASRMCWREWLTPGHSNRSSGRILDRNSDPIVASHASTIGLQNCFRQKIDRSSGCGVWGDFVIADLVSAHCGGEGGGGSLSEEAVKFLSDYVWFFFLPFFGDAWRLSRILSL